MANMIRITLKRRMIPVKMITAFLCQFRVIFISLRNAKSLLQGSSEVKLSTFQD
jgi:hypothetical protein